MTPRFMMPTHPTPTKHMHLRVCDTHRNNLRKKRIKSVFLKPELEYEALEFSSS